MQFRQINISNSFGGVNSTIWNIISAVRVINDVVVKINGIAGEIYSSVGDINGAVLSKLIV